jgi:CheY-like chemotaxis protein
MNVALVRCDGYQIKEVVSNLLGNAAKFCQADGAVALKLEYQNFMPRLAVGEDTQGKKFKLLGDVDVVITVRDNGPGIREDQLDRVFLMYQQTEREHRSPSSSGLGLFISKSIVEAHGGNIRCENVPVSDGHGAIFSLTIRMPVGLHRTTKRNNSSTAPIRSTALPANPARLLSIDVPSQTIVETESVTQQTPPNDASQYMRDASHARPLVNLAARERLRRAEGTYPALRAYPPVKLPGSTISPPACPPRRIVDDPSAASAEMNSTGASSPSQDAPAAAVAAATTSASGKIRVLFVEDCPMTRKLWKKILVGSGFDFVEADDGVTCLQQFGLDAKGMRILEQVHHFDLILMDGSMKIMDGAMATRLLRTAGVTIPIAGLTANALPADVDAFMSSQASHVFIKGSERLTDAVVTWIRSQCSR